MSALLGFSGQTIAAFVAVAVVLIVVGAMTASRMRRRDHPPEIPDAMAAGPSDADLEKPLLEKLQAWMLLLIVLFAIWIPVYWLREPAQNVDDERVAVAEAIERGRMTTEEFEEGVNELGFGCVRCHGDGLQGGTNFFQGQFVPVPKLTDVCGRLTLEQVQDVIRNGRPGTDMPSWSVRAAGPLDDQQINDIVMYLLDVQEVSGDQNLCLNPPSDEAG